MCRISLVYIYTHTRNNAKVRSILGKWRSFFLLFNPCLLTESPYHAWLIQVKPFNLLSHFISCPCEFSFILLKFIQFIPLHYRYNWKSYPEKDDLKINSKLLQSLQEPPLLILPLPGLLPSLRLIRDADGNTKIREFLPLPPLHNKEANSARFCFQPSRNSASLGQQLSLSSTSALTLLPARGWIFSRAPSGSLLVLEKSAF